MRFPLESWRRGRLRPWAAAVLVAGAVSGCADATDPGGGLPITLGLTLNAVAGGPAEAYARADAIAVTVRVGGTTVFDETQPFSPEAGETRVRVRLDPDLAGSTVTVAAELRAAGAPLFRGSGSATLNDAAPTELSVPLTPVVTGVVAANPAAAFTAIGETLTLSAAGVFATGDTVPGATITWRSLDPSIVSVSSGGGTATSQAEGTARLEASAGGATASTTATVVAAVSRVSVTPPAATVSVGQSATFQAQAFDRNANPLVRTFTWSAGTPAVAAVTPAGVATGVSAGVSNIVAAAGGAQGSAVLTVVDAPLPPGPVTGEILSTAARTFRLTWQDNATNETYFSIERRVDGGPWSEIGRADPDATTFEGTGLTGDNDLRVLACNAVGCSAPSNVVRLTFVGGPPVATTLDSPDIGVMAGTVSAATPYTVYFQYGHDPSDFDEDGGSESECPCYEEAGPIEGSGTQEFTLPVELWYSDYPLYYRIVARNEFGESVGSLESTSFPDVDTEASPTSWDYGSSNTFRAEIVVPSGRPNPIESVAFEVQGFGPVYNAVVTDRTASESTSSSGTIYSYRATWTAPSDDAEIGGFLYVDVIVTFTSGASMYAPYLTLSQFTGADR